MLSDSALAAAARTVSALTGGRPSDFAIILGSGLGDAVSLHQPDTIPYHQLFPGMPPLVSGHAGALRLGTQDGQALLVFSGRLHCYQGFSAHQVAFPVRLAASLGVRRLILTNAAGGIAEELTPGSLMFVADHLNLMGDHPLKGGGEADFLDLSSLYRNDLYAGLDAAARAADIRLRRGVLAAVPGPTYETPAEIRMLRILGADAVSMSLVPEALQAAACGMEVVGLSAISNRAAGLTPSPLSHAEVLASGRLGAASLSRLLPPLFRLWGHVSPRHP